MRVSIFKEWLTPDEQSKLYVGDFYLDNDDNKFTCTVSDIDLGHPIMEVDLNGNMIFTNHIFLYSPMELGEGCTVSVMKEGKLVDFGVSNYHCSHCPIDFSKTLIIGVYNDVTDQEFLYIGK